MFYPWNVYFRFVKNEAMGVLNSFKNYSEKFEEVMIRQLYEKLETLKKYLIIMVLFLF